MAIAYRYYRLLLSKNSNNDNRYYTINEFALYENSDASGDNLCDGATASASGAYGSQAAGLAIDGNPTTFWESEINGAPSWLKVDLGAEQIVRAMVIKSTTYPIEVPKDFVLQGSNDDSVWQNIAAYIGLDKFITSNGVFVFYLGVKGTSLLEDGTPSSKVLVHAWGTGELIAGITPRSDGSYRYSASSAIDVLITHIGPAGYRPISDGPITPGDI